MLAYPQFTVSTASAGVWFTGIIQPVADLPIISTVANFFPFDFCSPVSSWAWWSDGVWIGPRHTYADGSICAYERADSTWSRSMGARLLLDLTSLWIARQIFLRAHGRWPGMQHIHTALERIGTVKPVP